MDNKAPRFDADYEETVHLRDGTRVVLRLIRPSDKAQLRAAFERLSPESRYSRFLSPRSALTDRELRYLTEVDGKDHVALVALKTPLLGQEEGIGVARFIRLAGQADVAEPAITVADDHQGKGLGSILLRRLTEAAWERGVRQFHCQVLARNDQMRQLLDEMHTDVRIEEVEDGAVVVTFPIEAPVEAERPALRPMLRRFFSHVAQELLDVIPTLGRTPQEEDA